MRSKTYCFNTPLYRRTVLRLWPIWVACALLYFFVLPAPLWQDLAYGSRRLIQLNPAYFAMDYVYDLTLDGYAIISAIIACVTGVFVWNWLFTARSANCHFALPLRREGLFLTNYLAGLTVCILPLAINLVLTLLVELAFGCVHLPSLLTFFGAGAAASLLFFSLATLCAVATGNIVAMPVFFLILNFLTAGIYYLLMHLFETFVFGMNYSNSLTDWVRWFTPMVQLTDGCSRIYSSEWIDGTYYSFTIGIKNFWYYAVYAGVGVGLAGAALAAFRKRPAEAAGDVIAFHWLKPVFRIGVTLCFAVLMTMFVQDAYFYSNPNFVLTLILIAIWGLIGFFGAEMLLKKSFRVFSKRSFTTYATVIVCALAVLICVDLDLFGYERRIPDADDVNSVVISGVVDNVEADYADASALHRAIINGDRKGEDVYLTLTYELKSGKALSRSYSVNRNTEEYELLKSWVNREEVLIADAFGAMESLDQLEWVYVSSHTDVGYYEIDGQAEDAARIYEALLRDFAEGNSSFEYRYGGSYDYDILFGIELRYYRLPYDQSVYGSRSNYEDEVSSYWSYIYITSNMHNTLAVLETLTTESYDNKESSVEYYYDAEATVIDFGY